MAIEVSEEPRSARHRLDNGPQAVVGLVLCRMAIAGVSLDNHFFSVIEGVRTSRK